MPAKAVDTDLLLRQAAAMNFKLALTLPALACCLLIGACKKSDTAEEAPATEATTAAEPQDQAAPVAAGEADLPAIDLALVESAKLEEGRRHNQLGLDKQRAKDFEGAIAMYKKALDSDPGNLMARYNLATAHNLAGNGPEAVKILRQFSEVEGCPICQGRLARAAKDGDFASLAGNADFVALTSKADVPTVELKDAATTVAGAFVAQKVDGDAAALLHPRNSVEIVTVVGACDGPPEECTGKQMVVGSEQLEAELEEWFPVAAKVDSCDDKCCTVSTDAQEVGDVNSRLDKLCFATDSGGVVTLDALHRTEGP